MSTSNKICNDTSTSNYNDDGVCEINNLLQNMKTTDVEETSISARKEGSDVTAPRRRRIIKAKRPPKVIVCANCGKEGSDITITNTCNKCKMVKYCNAACKKKHRSKHKKACERRVAELHEEALFKEVDPEECPICLISMIGQTTFQPCCGKTICRGCVYAIQMSEGKDKCAFCRTLNAATYEEQFERLKKQMDKGNADALYMVAGLYERGIAGFPKDMAKAHELYLKAGELGCAMAYHNLGVNYENGWGVEMDKEKSNYYYERAAMNGSIPARHNLGVVEWNAGDYHRAMKHFVVAAKLGHELSLNNVKKGFMIGKVTKDEYASTLRAYHERQKEMKSDERDKAAASDMFLTTSSCAGMSFEPVKY